jgi:general secretion pathway protein M
VNLPDGTRGQFVALALLLIVIILATKFLLMPLADLYRETDDEIFDMRQDIVRYRHLLAEHPGLQKMADRLKHNDPLSPITLPGGNQALAAAELQQRLQDAAKKNGVRIVSLRIRPPGTEGPMERIAVEARMQAETVGLRNLLFELETGTPYLFLDQLSIRSRTARRRRTSSESLDVRLELHGMRPVQSTTMASEG